MFRSLHKLIAAAAVLLLASVGFVVLETPERANAALKGSMFDPGLIISDSVFYDFGTMTADDIQRFLDSKVSVCKDSDGGPRCIKDFVMDTPAIKGEDGRCASLPAAKAQTAAQIIFTVAQACKINPRVIIITLQKEQGLIQASNPTQRMYDYALGMACPDTAAGCSKSAAGFFYQLYKGVGQLQWYGDPRGSFNYLKVGTNISRRYQDPRVEKSLGKDCGQRTFQLKSQATAALYYYTPYTPNDSALANLYGGGDACSAYGNRNFWRFYSDWFGSPIGGGFLLKSDTSPTYLIVDDTKYQIADQATTDSLKPLGPLGTVSQAYLDSFKDGGAFTPLVRNAAKQLFLIAGGAKYSVANCDIALELGLDCAKAITLTASQLSALTNAGVTTTYVAGDGADRYLIDNGEIHEILDAPSVVAANVKLPALSTAKISSFQYLPYGAPIASNGSLFIDRTTNQTGVYLTGEFYRIDPAVAKEIDFTKWFTPSAGSLSPQGLSAVETGVTLEPFVSDSNSNRWLISGTGKRKVSASSPFVDQTPQVDAQLLSRIPTTDTEVAAPAFVTTASKNKTFYVSGGLARPIYSSTDKVALAPSVKQAGEIFLLPSAFAQLSVGPTLIAPGSVVKPKTGTDIYVVNSFSSMIQMPDQAALVSLGLGAPRKVDAEAIAGYNTKTSFSGVKFICNGDTYVASGGEAIIVDPAAVAHLPGKSAKFSDEFCYNLPQSTNTLGRFIRVAGSKTFYLIDSGKKRPIASYAAYVKLLGDQLPAVTIEASLAARFATGTAAPTKMPTGKATSSSTVGSSTGGTGTSTGGSGTAASKYTVKAGDTLSSIASRFAIKLATLMTANKITNANSIQIGQVLTIPKS
jgi:hypothetical protein